MVGLPINPRWGVLVVGAKSSCSPGQDTQLGRMARHRMQADLSGDISSDVKLTTPLKPRPGDALGASQFGPGRQLPAPFLHGDDHSQCASSRPPTPYHHGT